MITLREYSDRMTADVNRKGVLDIDTVKGCTAGMKAYPMTGCYGACYAAKTARFRGIDFTTSVVRKIKGSAHARNIERAVRRAPEGFFRIGTMGDPSHAWEYTTRIVEWLAPSAVPVIVTKHWRVASDVQLSRLRRSGAIINTSVSALDTPQELRHRKRQIMRYAAIGGVSVVRVVSCDFDPSSAAASVQAQLFALGSTIDNPLRVDRSHDLVTSGAIKVIDVRDLNTVRPVSVANTDTYLGHCASCPEKCGLAFRGPEHPKPTHPQIELLAEVTP